MELACWFPILGLYSRYQRSTTAISVGEYLGLCLYFFDSAVHIICMEIYLLCLPAVAPICYAHLAAAQVGQFIKFDEMSETSSSHGEHTSAGSVPVQELPRLHDKVRSSMFFCWAAHAPVLSGWLAYAICHVAFGGCLWTLVVWWHRWWHDIGWLDAPKMFSRLRKNHVAFWWMFQNHDS